MLRRNFLKNGIISISAFVTASIFSRAAYASSEHTVQIRGMRFSPKIIDVKIGDTIIFKNKDSAPHTATSKSKSWTTDLLNFGDEESIEIQDGMVTDYFCKYHTMMKGKIRIV
jgi:plastocyanin